MAGSGLRTRATVTSWNRTLAVILACSLGNLPATGTLPRAAWAQSSPAATPEPQAVNQTPAEERLSQAQLEQMLAPIALYPDQLLAQMLMAATYPLEIVQAKRWLGRNDHAAL